MSSTNSRRMRVLALAAISAATLGFAACGDDDETTTTTPIGATGTAGATGTEGATDTDLDTGEATTNFSDAIRDQLAAAGVDSEAADCVVEDLEENVGEDEITQAEEDLQSGGQLPQSLLDASIEAAQNCLPEAQQP